MYHFKTYAPFMQRRKNFPDDVIRVSKASMIVSANVMEGFPHRYRRTVDNEKERMTLLFGVDPTKKVIQLVPDHGGYTFQVRANGNGYINTTRLNLTLPLGDYTLTPSTTEYIFRLAK